VIDSVGIIGAGRLGQAMARTAVPAGRRVVIANSRGPESLASVVSARRRVSAGTVDEVASAGIVVAAVPWDRVPEAVHGLKRNGRVVVDATNDWAADDLQGRTSSELVADLVPGARVVKAGNTLGAEVLGDSDASRGARATLLERLDAWGRHHARSCSTASCCRTSTEPTRSARTGGIPRLAPSANP
jgi:predicted dinucleotide-binding enzyme